MFTEPAKTREVRYFDPDQASPGQVCRRKSGFRCSPDVTWRKIGRPEEPIKDPQPNVMDIVWEREQA